MVGGAARTVAAIVAIIPAGRGFPQFLAGLRVEGHDELLPVALALRVNPAVHDSERRISFAEPVGLPHHSRSAGGPGREQAGLRRNSVAIGPAPLRPVGCEGCERKK